MSERFTGKRSRNRETAGTSPAQSSNLYGESSFKKRVGVYPSEASGN